MRRIRLDTGELYLPHRGRDGRYRVADPTLGNAMKLTANQIAVETDSELLSYVRRGFAVRMKGIRTGQVNLIAASEIQT